MIDYMQLMDNPGGVAAAADQRNIARVKSVARELNIPDDLPVAAQSCNGRARRASTANERSARSGSIEQDADVGCCASRRLLRMSEPDFQPDNIAELIIAKQRNGPTGREADVR